MATAKKITLRTVHNRVSTSITKALTERIFVEKMTQALLNGKKSEEIVKKLLDFVYRNNEYKKYLEKYNAARTMTKRGEANTPIILAMNTFVDEYRLHNCLNRNIKYDGENKKHRGLHVLEDIQNDSLEVIDSKALSYKKASYHDQFLLIEQSQNILNNLFKNFDVIEAEYESMECKKTQKQMEYEMAMIHLQNDTYSKVQSICEMSVGYDIYDGAYNILSELKNKVRKSMNTVEKGLER